MCFVDEIKECCWVSLLLSLEWKTKYQNSTQVQEKKIFGHGCLGEVNQHQKTN